jgi:hypothetical protein
MHRHINAPSCFMDLVLSNWARPCIASVLEELSARVVFSTSLVVESKVQGSIRRRKHAIILEASLNAIVRTVAFTFFIVNIAADSRAKPAE